MAPITPHEAEDDAHQIVPPAPDQVISEEGVRFITELYLTIAREKAMEIRLQPTTPEFEKIEADATERASRDLHAASFSNDAAEKLMAMAPKKQLRIEPWRDVSICRQLLEQVEKNNDEAAAPPLWPAFSGPNTQNSPTEEEPDYGEADDGDAVMPPSP